MASCYPKGSQIEINSNQILSSPCANGLVFNNTYNFTVNITRIEKVKKNFFILKKNINSSIFNLKEPNIYIQRQIKRVKLC
jgi:hypothetical protein